MFSVSPGSGSFAIRVCDILATVGASKNSRTDKRHEKVFVNIETILLARMESPPSSKKLSWMPTSSIPRVSDHIFATIDSVGVRGAANGLLNSGRFLPGGGSAWRFTLPLGFKGNESNTANLLGTI